MILNIKFKSEGPKIANSRELIMLKNFFIFFRNQMRSYGSAYALCLLFPQFRAFVYSPAPLFIKAKFPTVFYGRFMGVQRITMGITSLVGILYILYCIYHLLSYTKELASYFVVSDTCLFFRYWTVRNSWQQT